MGVDRPGRQGAIHHVRTRAFEWVWITERHTVRHRTVRSAAATPLCWHPSQRPLRQRLNAGSLMSDFVGVRKSTDHHSFIRSFIHFLPAPLDVQSWLSNELHSLQRANYGNQSEESLEISGGSVRCSLLGVHDQSLISASRWAHQPTRRECFPTTIVCR